MFRIGGGGPEVVLAGGVGKAGEGTREGLRREPFPGPPLDEGTPVGRGRNELLLAELGKL